jgi:hypothetical protein
MGAPKENQFWKLRNTHGRDKLFATPDLLLEACQEYFNWVDAHPKYKVEQIKRPYEQEIIATDGTKTTRWVTITKIPLERPYTIQGLCIYLGCNVVWFNQFEYALAEKEDQLSKDFSKVLSHVRDVIYQQKFEGAAVGAFNASIIARDLSLVDKSDLTTNGKDILTEKSDEDLKKLLQETLKKIDE